MVFNSIHFVAFFAVVYAVYRLLGHRAQNVWLLAASYYFYAAWDWRFTGLLAASTLVSYRAGLALGRPAVRASRPRALRVLWAALGFLLAVLGFFKYAGFFVDSAARAFSAIGVRRRPPGARDRPAARHLVLHVHGDGLRRRRLPRRDAAGHEPRRLRALRRLLPAPRRRADPARAGADAAVRGAAHDPRASDLTTGGWLIATGLFKKIVVADNLSPLVDAVFAPAFPAAGGDVLIATYAFALQIYGDFAGYSDMARGISQLFGIELNVNFRFPYAVTNPREFWRHWHISLSTWLRDYLYKPLGGSRGGTWATNRNLLITMVLGGLWHGAAWSFVLWGAYQGAWLVAHRGYEAWRGVGARASRAGVDRGLVRRRCTWCATAGCCSAPARSSRSAP